MKGSWSVVISRDPDNNPEGVLVFHKRKYRGFNLILMPPMTFYNGIHFFYKDNIKEHSKIGFENRVTEKLMSLLPKHDLYYQQYSPSFTNWISLFWKDYNQSTRYTYLLKTDIEKNILWNQLKGNVRRNIKKAQELCEIQNIEISDFWTALENSFNRRSTTNPFQKELISRLTTNLMAINSCHIRVCVEKSTQKILAGSVVAFDANSSYYVCGFFNPDGKEIGALSYLLWDNIVSAKTPIFDFEGSMLKEVEYFFRAFGGTLSPHFRIWKVNSSLLKIITKFVKLPFLR